jgi:branched-subunit amino acid transport protein
MTSIGLGTWAIWGVIVAVAVGTFALRSSFILLFGWVGELPSRPRAALRFVPAAVFAGLAFPAFVYLDGSLVVSASNERLIAGGFATAVAWRTENMIATIVAGMATLWLFTLVL